MKTNINIRDGGRSRRRSTGLGWGLAAISLFAVSGCATPFSRFATPWATLPVELADVRSGSDIQICNDRSIDSSSHVIAASHEMNRPILPDPFLDSRSETEQPSQDVATQLRTWSDR